MYYNNILLTRRSHLVRVLCRAAVDWRRSISFLISGVTILQYTYTYMYIILWNIHIFCSSDRPQIPLLYNMAREKIMFFCRSVLLLKTIRFFSPENVYVPNGTVVRRVCVYGSFYSLVLSITLIFFTIFFLFAVVLFCVIVVWCPEEHSRTLFGCIFFTHSYII